MKYKIKTITVSNKDSKELITRIFWDEVSEKYKMINDDAIEVIIEEVVE